MKKNKKPVPHFGRLTEVILSICCLGLFTLGLTILFLLPLWLGAGAALPVLINPGYQQVLAWIAYLLLVPVGGWLVVQSLRLLNKVEEMSGRWKPFTKRLKKIRRRENKPRPGNPAPPFNQRLPQE